MEYFFGELMIYTIEQFFMIRKLVLTNEAVTDFWCILNFMDMKGSDTVF